MISASAGSSDKLHTSQPLPGARLRMLSAGLAACLWLGACGKAPNGNVAEPSTGGDGDASGDAATDDPDHPEPDPGDDASTGPHGGSDGGPSGDGDNDASVPPEPPPFMPPQITAERAPAFPLVASDPYFSIWSFSDQLCGTWPQHWTGAVHALVSMLRVDGQTYTLMGNADNKPACAPQTDVLVTPTRTVYRFNVPGVEVRLSFFSPRLAEDLDVFSRPVAYVTYDVRATDASEHDVRVYFDNSAELVVNTPDQEVTWSRPSMPGFTVQRVGTTEQPVLKRAGDNVRIDWGYVYQAVPTQSGVEQVVATDTVARANFAGGQPLPASDDTRNPRKASDAWPVLATTFTLDNVGADWATRTLLLAYDDEYSIELLGTRLRPYWRRNGDDAAALIQKSFAEYESLLLRSQAFDAELVEDLEAAGGKDYMRLAVLSYRQAMAAHKLVASTDGKPLFFSKENFSNGCIATVDVTYPSSPLFLLLNPALMQGMVTPIADYAKSSRWKFDFAPHDLGTYPLANGQVYGGGENSVDNQMPVEESANLVLLFAAIAKARGNMDYASEYWDLIVKWSHYLETQGFDPASQLSTDDFAGHLAHNVNLSAKAILALGAYGQMAEARGEAAEATRVRTLVTGFVSEWISKADDGDHTKLAFDANGTWSQKYNLVWDRILGLNYFPQATLKRELTYARTKLGPYGLPLDNRRTYTKLDWIVWTATLSGDRDDFDALISPLARFLDDTPDRVPLTDWFETTDARKAGFQARSVVGGVYLPLLYDGALWQKWAARAP